MFRNAAAKLDVAFPTRIQCGIVAQKEARMNWILKFTIAAMMVFALAAAAQQTSTMPSVDEHMKFLTTQLDLTADQQAKLRPIVQRMQESAEKVTEDESLTSDARHEKLKALHEKALKEARGYLNPDQQQKLDSLEKNPHPDAH